jgi:hypothetical protein
MQIQIYCYKANHTRDITLHTDINYFSLHMVENTLHQKMCYIKFVDVNEIRISCHCMEYLYDKLFLGFCVQRA